MQQFAGSWQIKNLDLLKKEHALYTRIKATTAPIATWLPAITKESAPLIGAVVLEVGFVVDTVPVPLGTSVSITVTLTATEASWAKAEAANKTVKRENCMIED